jgi:hypothetical protein
MFWYYSVWDIIITGFSLALPRFRKCEEERLSGTQINFEIKSLLEYVNGARNVVKQGMYVPPDQP